MWSPLKLTALPSLGSGSPRVTALARRARARRHLPRPRPRCGSAGAGPTAAIFRRDGEYWTIAFGERVLRLRDSKGLCQIANLLRHPGRDLHVLDLAAARWKGPEGPPGPGPARSDGHPDLGDAGEMLDAKARPATMPHAWRGPRRNRCPRPRACPPRRARRSCPSCVVSRMIAFASPDNAVQAALAMPEAARRGRLKAPHRHPRRRGGASSCAGRRSRRVRLPPGRNAPAPSHGHSIRARAK